MNFLYNCKKLRKMRFIDERRKSDQFAKVRNDMKNCGMMMEVVILSSFAGKPFRQCQCVNGNDDTYIYMRIYSLMYLGNKN